IEQQRPEHGECFRWPRAVQIGHCVVMWLVFHRRCALCRLASTASRYAGCQPPPPEPEPPPEPPPGGSLATLLPGRNLLAAHLPAPYMPLPAAAAPAPAPLARLAVCLTLPLKL